jgi:hypothetical protein
MFFRQQDKGLPPYEGGGDALRARDGDTRHGRGREFIAHGARRGLFRRTAAGSTAHGAGLFRRTAAGSAAASEMPALRYAFSLFPSRGLPALRASLYQKERESCKERVKRQGLFTSRPWTLLNLGVWCVLLIRDTYGLVVLLPRKVAYAPAANGSYSVGLCV